MSGLPGIGTPYVLSRTTGLPAAHGDVGNWTEPLGLAALFVEGAVVAVSSYAYSLAAVAPRAQAGTSPPRIAATRS